VWKRSAKENIDAEQIFAEMSQIMKAYKITYVVSDQWAADVLVALARRHEIGLMDQATTATSKTKMYENARVRLADGQVELPPDPKMREELLRVRKTATKAGYTISSPILADGSHGDLASALVLGLSQPMQDPYVPPRDLTLLEKDLLSIANDRKKAIEETRKNDKKRVKQGRF
jgi:phage terminase large subunit-like protein